MKNALLVTALMLGAFLFFFSCANSCGASDGGSAKAAKVKTGTDLYYCNELEDHFDIDARSLVESFVGLTYVFAGAENEAGETIEKPAAMPASFTIGNLKSCSFGYGEVSKNSECSLQLTRFTFSLVDANDPDAEFTFVSWGAASSSLSMSNFQPSSWIFSSNYLGDISPDGFTSLRLKTNDGASVFTYNRSDSD